MYTAKAGTISKKLNPISPELGDLREKRHTSPYRATRKGLGRTDMYLFLVLTIFLSMFCFASSTDKDTLLRVRTVTRDDSFPRESCG